MPIYHQGRKVKAVYHQGRKVREIWHMGRRIYTSKPVEVMPPTAGQWDAQNWLRGKLTEYGEYYTTVTELPFDIDSRNATDMTRMFQDCSSLTTVPQMDTAQVTKMSSMFIACSALTSVPEMDTRNVTNMENMFRDCSSLTDGNVTLTVKRKDANTYRMIYNSGLTREPFLTIE